MSVDCISCLLETAGVYFSDIEAEGYGGMLDGLKKELRQAEKLVSQIDCAKGADGLDKAMRAAAAVKKAGVYPFYITSLAAAAVYCEAKNDFNIANTIEMTGIRDAVEIIFDYDMQPELSFMIACSYERILGGCLFDIDERKLGLMKQAYENGFANEAAYTGCAQCALKAYFDTMGLAGEKQDYLFRAASSMAGGVACCSDSACGAYSACNLIIGTYVGRTLENLGQADNKAGKSNEIGQIIHDRFEDTYGSVNCCDLHVCKYGRSYNLRDKTESAAMHEAGGHDEICPTTVGIAASWLVETLYDAAIIE